jgi:hypothetical protein
MKPILLIAAASILLPGIAIAASEPAFTDDFDLENCRFASDGGNPYFILKPGRQAYFSNYRCVQSGECEELEELWITVRGTRDISLWDDGKKRVIQTRVVEEKETADGELVEISRNFFASCLPNRDVYYFGEDVDIYEDGEIVSHDGAWRAGRHGAEPGIIMPESAFIIGQRYFQELAPDVALDRAEHVAIDLEVEVPAGVFEDCVNVIETTPLEPGSESSKTYCPGVGLVADGELELVSVFGPPKHR